MPNTAHDVNYRTNLHYTIVDFAVSEDALREWCRARKWDVSPVAPDSIVVFKTATDPPKYRYINDALSFGELAGEKECNLVGVYDRAIGKACLQYICR